jgi:hypothetical protein
MSLAKYIPLREASVQYGNKDMPVVAIKGFTIDISRLTASYEIWLNVNDASGIVAASDNVVTNAISMVSTDMNEAATFIIDGVLVSCFIKHYIYHSIKHAYLVKIEFLLDKNEVKSYMFEEENGEQTRFDILDL